MRDTVTETIGSFVKERMRRAAFRTRWDDPLVGFADAADPLFARLKTAVSPSHAMPEDLLAGARTVIAWFLPFTRDIVFSNREGRLASPEWAVAYIDTNRLITEINEHLAQVLQGWGFHAAVTPPTHNFDTKHLMSDWSHKHVAYIAGLGNFGIHHLLITERGCCGRLGSMVTDAVIRPSERADGECCLAKYNNSCRLCMQNCVAGALSDDGFDRHACHALLLENAEMHRQEGLADVCGKCSSVVPCSFDNPVKALIHRNT